MVDLSEAVEIVHALEETLSDVKRDIAVMDKQLRELADAILAKQKGIKRGQYVRIWTT